MKTLKYTFIIAVLISSAAAQVSQQWAKRFNSSGTVNDAASALTFDAAGNVYVTGTGNGNYVTIKYSPAGDLLWQAVYSGPANDADNPSAICVDASGNVYVTGRSFGNGTETDFATVKYDAAGNELWVQRFNGTNNSDDAGIGIGIDGSGNVYAGGWSGNAGNDIDFAVLKYSPSGSQLWVRYYNGPEDAGDYMTAMKTDDAGNIYATGKSRGTSNNDYATVKFSPSGTLLWSVRYQGGGTDEPSAIAFDQAGNVYVTGTAMFNFTGKDYTTIKYNNAGVQQWMKKFDRADSTIDNASAIAVDNSGNVFVTGYCTGFGSPSYDYVTVAYGPNGNELWAKSYTGPLVGEDDKAFSVDVDTYGNIYVTGSCITSGSDNDYATIKYSPAGVQQWVMVYESVFSGSDNAAVVKADANGNIYVTGSSTGITGYDYLTVKYSQPIGIEPVSSEIPSAFTLSQNYPNPFNPSTAIEFSLPEAAQTRLSVFDISGREVSVPVNENLAAGTYKIVFSAGSLSSGTYFYRLDAGEYSEVKKMILVK